MSNTGDDVTIRITEEMRAQDQTLPSFFAFQDMIDDGGYFKWEDRKVQILGLSRSAIGKTLTVRGKDCGPWDGVTDANADGGRLTLRFDPAGLPSDQFNYTRGELRNGNRVWYRGREYRVIRCDFTFSTGITEVELERYVSPPPVSGPPIQPSVPTTHTPRAHVSVTFPHSPQIGEMIRNPATQQLQIFDGTSWVLVPADSPAAAGSAIGMLNDSAARLERQRRAYQDRKKSEERGEAASKKAEKSHVDMLKPKRRLELD